MAGGFRLDGRIGWRAAATTGLAIGRGGVSLAVKPGTGRPLAADDGSFGGMTVPVQVAVGPGELLCVLDGAGRVLLYDPCTERFAPLACLSTPPLRPGLGAPVAIAIDPSGRLILLDGTARTLSFIRLADGYPLRRTGPFAPDGNGLRTVKLDQGTDPLTGGPDGTASAPAGAWTPADVAVLADGRLLVSDRDAGALRLFDTRGCYLASWTGATETQPPLVKPGALAVGTDGRIFVVEQGEAAIAILDAEGNILERSTDPALLAGDFAPSSIAVDADGTIWIGHRLDGAVTRIGRDAAGQCCPPERVRLTPAECRILAFDRDGNAIHGSARQPCLIRTDSTAWLTEGLFTSDALDSGMTGTRWDRLHLALTIPEGTSVTLLTTTSDAPLGTLEVAALGSDRWAATPLTGDEGGALALAIRSAPGRYLWIRLALAGDGTATPSVTGIDVTTPRRTSARYLPGVYSADAASADFLERFLGLFDELRERMLDPIEQLPALYDPLATPAAEAGASGADFLDWLAGWIGIALDRHWSIDRRRRLVREAPELFRIRGTVEGLKRFVAIYTGVEPRLVEHFRLRRWLTLGETPLDGTAKLWGPEIVRRLELDRYSQIGDFALVDGGDPLTDPIAAFAHRCTLYVPVGENFSDRDAAALDDVIAMATPAHVAVDVKLARPRFVIGCDCLLGVNTVLGRGCETARTDESVLGEDIRLAGPPTAFTLGSGMRLGPDTTLQ